MNSPSAPLLPTDVAPLVAPPHDEPDPFLSESTLTTGTALTAATRGSAPAWIRNAAKWIAVAGASAATALGAAWIYQQRTAAPSPGSLTLATTPVGMQVAIAGKPAGVTPLTVSLPAGHYQVALAAADGRRRELDVVVNAGSSVVQHVEMGAPPAPAAAATGALYVDTEPTRQEVIVDGVSRGISPISVAGLAAGEHVVAVRSRAGTLTRRITVQDGATASLVISAGESPALRAGWVTFHSPVQLQVTRDGNLVGTTSSDRLLMAAGDHQIEMTNEALGFRASRRITVAPDRTTTVAIEVPDGRVNINALPWAEVWVGGERIGETPIANLTLPIGSHDVLLRHPELGDRKATVTVSLRQTARLGVDMRTP